MAHVSNKPPGLMDVIPPPTLWWTYKKQLKMAIEIVDFPMKNGDFPWQNVTSPEGNTKHLQNQWSSIFSITWV